MTATQQLNRRLITLAATGNRPRCSDPVDHALWTSDEPRDRATAARWCKGREVLTLCHQAAIEQDTRFGVWGGRDLTVRPGRKKAA
jgi:hypothetical protein